MTTYLSPAIFINEIDLSHIPTTGIGVIPVFIGTAEKGPLYEPVYVNNTQEFLDTFGRTLSDANLAHTYYSYAEKAGRGNAWILRVAIEYEEGMASELAAIAIDSIEKEHGWGRIALFQGIEKGQLCFREISTTNPLDFHDASVANITFTGAANGDLTFTIENYNGASDETFTIQITGDPTDPTNSNIHGATYTITTSDGTVVATGTFDDSNFDDISTPITIQGMTFTASAIGTYPVTTGDFWTFTAEPDNLSFSFSVDGGTATVYSFTDGDNYTLAADFVTALNTLIGAGAPYIALVEDDYACVQTDNYGERIQFISTGAFGLETGLTIYSIDIPRAHFTNNEPGPITLSTVNNELNMTVIDQDTNYEFDISVPAATYTIQALAAYLNTQGYYNGAKVWNTYAILYRETDGTDGYRLVIETDDSYEYSQLKINADYSHIKTLRFADEVGFNYPYNTSYEAFYDSRIVLPEASTSSPSTPQSCITAPASAQCTIDSDYYQNIVGFIVAKYAGTWIDDFTVTIESQMVEATGNLYTIYVYKNGVIASKIENVSFDANSDNYIADKINPDTTGGGINGNPFISWEERPTALNNDPSDTSYEIRNPGSIYNRSLTNGENGIPPSAVYSSELDKAVIGNEALGTGIYTFQNPEIYDMTVLVIPGITSGSVIATAINFCQNRSDCIYIIDPPFGLKPSEIVDWHNGVLSGSDVLAALNSSYAALYWSWIKWYNTFDGDYVYIPPSGFVTGTISYSDRVSEVWYPPAGLKRGLLTTALDVEYNPNQTERDLLYGYDNAVNPIAKFHQQGIAIWGQRTLQRADTALDRVNVRLLINEIKRRSIPTLRNFIFEFNDEPTRNSVTRLLEIMMGDIEIARGVTDWRVICNKTNNTPERIDRNELWISILFKPTKAIEFIVLNLAILSESQNIAIEEILTAAGIAV